MLRKELLAKLREFRLEEKESGREKNYGIMRKPVHDL